MRQETQTFDSETGEVAGAFITFNGSSTFQHLKEYLNKITHLHTILLWEMLWRSKQIIITINSSAALVKMLPDCKKWAYHNILPALRRKQESGHKVIQTSESKAVLGSKVISLIEMFLNRWSVNISNMILQTGKGTHQNKGDVGERKNISGQDVLFSINICNLRKNYIT